jgi:serine/threonine-protein kinase
VGIPDRSELAGVAEGQVLAGKYRVERVLGVGGMGAVVAAQHLQLETRVAIKFLLPQMLAHEDAVARFAREARNAVRITNEHVARVLDVGTLDNGAPYMVMEYLQGADLSVLLQQRGGLPIEEVLDFILQAMEAIAEAHALGIVHRDLKPANLFCTRRPDGKPHVKVLDFGISKTLGPGAAGSLTATTALMGSPFYMSPEQMQASGAVDARTDIWSLGVIIFELLTGQTPFYGESIPEVCVKVAVKEPPPLRALRPDVPEGLALAIATCLQKDREQRYRNVAALALALQPFAPPRAKASVERIVDTIQAAGLGANAPSVSHASVPASPAHAVETIPALGRTATSEKGGKAIAGVLAAVSVLAVAGGLAVLRHLHGSGSGPGEAGRSSADAGELCVVGTTRCAGATPETCNAGRWIRGPVTAGKCGAACTPGSSPAQCHGNALQGCAPTGEWQDGDLCPFVCREGACAGECAPESTRCADTDGAQACDANGRWGSRTVCNGGSVCRDGACAPRQAPAGPAGPTGPATVRPAPRVDRGPTTASPPAAGPNCNPPYTIDSAGHRQYKPECP